MIQGINKMNYKDLIWKDIIKGAVIVGTCIILIAFCIIGMISYSNHRLLKAANQEEITFNYIIPNAAAETKDNHLFHISADITIQGPREMILTKTDKNQTKFLMMKSVPTSQLFQQEMNDKMKTTLFKNFEKTVKSSLDDYTTVSVINSFDEISYGFKADLTTQLAKQEIKVKDIHFSYSE